MKKSFKKGGSVALDYLTEQKDETSTTSYKVSNKEKPVTITLNVPKELYEDLEMLRTILGTKTITKTINTVLKQKTNEHREEINIFKNAMSLNKSKNNLEWFDLFIIISESI